MVQSVLRYYISIGWSLRRYMIPELLLTPIARIGTDYISPLIAAIIINKISAPERAELKSLTWYVVLFFAVPFVSEIIWRFVVWCMNRTDALGMERIANETFDDLMARSHDFHINSFSGSLVAKTSRFISAFESLHNTFVLDLVATVIGFIFAIAVLFFTSWPVALAFVALLFTYLIALYRFTRKRYVMSKARAEQESLQTAQLADSLANAITVKTFARERYELKLFKKVSSVLKEKRVRAWDYQNIPINALTTNIAIIMNTVALVGVLYAIFNLNAQIGSAFLILAYINQLTSKFWDFSRIMRSLESNISNAVEMMQLLKQSYGVTDVPDATTINIAKGNISLRGVTFSYHKKRPRDSGLFESLDLEIPAGQSVGVVGPSGGGKTTITKLLLRFMDVRDGVIEIDGQDIASVTQSSLRDVITYVPQEPLLFHRTLKENICYGRPSATTKQIIEAAKKANAHDFITSLPDGYDTLVGERGIKLSGGQRQRVALARAILKDASIVVLDEATSALDSESEKLIQDALFTLIEGRTTIVVAHRLSTIKQLNRIIVLEDGRIIEDGSHDELIQHKNGTYARLWSHQSGGFIE
jgi:ATP-binding cassette, subfamily B, bacterial